MVAIDVADDMALPDHINAGPSSKLDAVMVIERDADRLSTALLDYLNVAAINIVAPVTDRHWKKIPPVCDIYSKSWNTSAL